MIKSKFLNIFLFLGLGISALSGCGSNETSLPNTSSVALSSSNASITSQSDSSSYSGFSTSEPSIEPEESSSSDQSSSISTSSSSAEPEESSSSDQSSSISTSSSSAEPEEDIDGADLEFDGATKKTIEGIGECFYVNVRNNQLIFRFANHVRVNKNASWIVSTDLEGTKTIPSRTVELNVGHPESNCFYLHVSNEINKKYNTYIIVIHRNDLYTVCFYEKGIIPCKTIDVEEGFTIKEEDIPKVDLDGYTFLSWNYDFANPITENTSIIANLEAKEYLITYDVNGGDPLISNEQVVYYGEQYELTIPKKEGYTFVGWYDNETQITSGTWNYLVNKTIVAHWDKTKYSITYYLDDGVNSLDNPNIYCAGDSIVLGEPTKHGYTFDGWYDNSDYCGDRIEQIDNNYSGNISLYAKWILSPEYPNFKYSVNSKNEVYILGLYDTSINSLTIPSIIQNDDVTYTVIGISQGALKGCSHLVSLTLPFVGGSKTSVSAHEDTLFGYIFGKEQYDGSEKATQNYSSMSSYSRYITYYIPASLRNVTITGGRVFYGAFSYCEHLTNISLVGNTDRIDMDAFYECSSLKNVVVGGSVSHIETSAFSHCYAIESMTLSFIGCYKNSTSESGSTHLGCLFDRKANEKLTESYFYYVSGGSLPTKETVYIPNSLKYITITGGNIFSCSFNRCSTIEAVVITNDVTFINTTSNTFIGCSSLKKLFIFCSISDWYSLFNGGGSSMIGQCDIYSYSEQEPQDLGNYWHYVDGVPTIW